MLVDNDKYSKEKMSNYKNVLYPQIGTDFTYYYKDLGTTIVGIEYEGGVILGADSRSTSGSYVANRSNDKIYPLAKNIVACKAGAAADTQFILGTVVKYLNQFSMEYQDTIPVKVAVNLISKLTYNYKDYFSAALIVGGVDEEGSHVYSISNGSAIKQKLAYSGSGSFYTCGYMDNHFKENMTKENGIEFIVNSISIAIEKDNSSGGGIRVCDITKDGFNRLEYPFNRLPNQK